jgi:tetratricopeptide (TPR) repeat protein
MTRRTVLALLLIALTLASLGRIVGNGFVSLDDRQYIVENPRVGAGLSLEGARWAFESFHQANWHPLAWLSHQLDAQLFGLRPAGHHATSLALHAAAAVALLLALEGMTGAALLSFVVAALFAVHPLHVESVAWAAERKDVLSGFFWMLTLGVYLRYARRPGPRRLAVVALTFALGLLAKPMLVTLPLVLLLLDFWPLGRLAVRWRGAPVPGGGAGSIRAALLEKAPLFALSAAASAVTLVAQREGGAIFPLLTLPVATRVGNAALAYVRYLGQAAWPAGLSIFYPHPGDSLRWGAAAAALAGLAVLSAGALALARRRPWLAVGWLWYLGTLVPVIGLVQVGNQALADRYTYLPLVGVFLAAAWSGREATRRWAPARAAAPWVAGAGLLALGAAAAVQAGHWRDTLSVFSHAVRVTPGINWLAEANLGYEYERRGDHAEALAHFTRAVRRQPGIPDLRAALGTALLNLGREAEAERAYRDALRIDPASVDALFGLAYIQFGRGRLAEAAASYRRVLELDPAHFESIVNLANVLAQQGDAAGAAALYERAIALRPRDPRARFNLGALLVKQGRPERAAEQFAAALEIDPEFGAARNGLGGVYYRQGRFAEAAAQYELALRGAPDDAGIRGNLAQARARMAGAR